MKNNPLFTLQMPDVNDFKNNFVNNNFVFLNPAKIKQEGFLTLPSYEYKDLSIFLENLRV